MIVDLETTARMLYLVEAGDEGHTPYFLKRCVYAIAKKEGGGREALNKAYAICVAQAQKRGDLKKGTMQPTKSGDAASATKKKEKSPFGFSLKWFDQQLANARKKTESVTLAGVYFQLCEDLQLEQHVDMGKFKSAITQAVASAKSLQTALKAQSAVAAPGYMAQLVTLTLGSKGVMGALGLTGLLGAVGATNSKELAQHFEIMLARFRTAQPGPKMAWDRAAMKAAQLASELGNLKQHGGAESDMEAIVSSLSDVYLLLGQLAQVFVDGLTDDASKRAAEVVRFDMRGLGQSFMTLSMAHPG